MSRWLRGPSMKAAMAPEKAMPMAMPRRRRYLSARRVACVDSPVRPRPTPPPTPTEATMTPREGACAPRRMPPAADPRPVITTNRGLPRATNQPATGPRAAATNQMKEMGKPETRSMVAKASQRRGFARLSEARDTGAVYASRLTSTRSGGRYGRRGEPGDAHRAAPPRPIQDPGRDHGTPEEDRLLPGLPAGVCRARIVGGRHVLRLRHHAQGRGGQGSQRQPVHGAEGLGRLPLRGVPRLRLRSHRGRSQEAARLTGAPRTA